VLNVGYSATMLSTGLSVLGAPHSRDRFVTFTCLSACMGLVGATNPAALILAVCAILYRARNPVDPTANVGWGYTRWGRR
jgi:hypothetical protein